MLHWKRLDIAWNRYNQGGNIRGGREYNDDEHINLEVQIFSVWRKLHPPRIEFEEMHHMNLFYFFISILSGFDVWYLISFVCLLPFEWLRAEQLVNSPLVHTSKIWEMRRTLNLEPGERTEIWSNIATSTWHDMNMWHQRVEIETCEWRVTWIMRKRDPMIDDLKYSWDMDWHGRWDELMYWKMTHRVI